MTLKQRLEQIRCLQQKSERKLSTALPPQQRQYDLIHKTPEQISHLHLESGLVQPPTNRNRFLVQLASTSLIILQQISGLSN